MPKHRKSGSSVEKHWWKTNWLTSPSEIDQDIAKAALKQLGGKKKKK